MLRFKYGMRLRGFSPMCQPRNGFLERLDDTTGKYYDILVYDRKLTDRELSDYELNYLGEEKMMMDETVSSLWEQFRDMVNNDEPEIGCWATELHNIKTDGYTSTEGDVHRGMTWEDYFEWLIYDIEEMDFGDLEDLEITDVWYNGIDDEEAFAEDF